MTVSDNPKLRDFWKVVLCSSFTWMGTEYKFLLPAHKADTTFKRNRVHIACIIDAPDPHPIMSYYLRLQDHLFPLHLQLWLCANGSSPTHLWFLHCLRQFCPPEIAGQSICAGGATALAQAGAPGELIWGAEHWSSNAFKCYIQKNASCTDLGLCSPFFT